MDKFKYYLDESMGIYTIIDGKHMILLPCEEPLEADSFEELMEQVEYNVNEWRKNDEHCDECY